MSALLITALPSAAAAQAQTPATPTGVGATPTNQQVTLSWNPVTYATSYNVKRSAYSTGPWTTIKTTTSGTYTDSGLANTATWFYVISALNGTLEGPHSSPPVSVVVMPLAVTTNGTMQLRSLQAA